MKKEYFIGGSVVALVAIILYLMCRLRQKGSCCGTCSNDKSIMEEEVNKILEFFPEPKPEPITDTTLTTATTPTAESEGGTTSTITEPTPVDTTTEPSLTTTKEAIYIANQVESEYIQKDPFLSAIYGETSANLLQQQEATLKKDYSVDSGSVEFMQAIAYSGLT